MVPASYDSTESQNNGGSSVDREKRSDDDTHRREQEAELANVRDSLRNVPELSEERMVEIKDRIKRGYYSRSDVLERIAKRLTRHLTE